MLQCFGRHEDSYFVCSSVIILVLCVIVCVQRHGQPSAPRDLSSLSLCANMFLLCLFSCGSMFLRCAAACSVSVAIREAKILSNVAFSVPQTVPQSVPPVCCRRQPGSAGSARLLDCVSDSPQFWYHDIHQQRSDFNVERILRSCFGRVTACRLKDSGCLMQQIASHANCLSH